MKNKVFHNLVKGSLKSTIDAHGPITQEFLESASRRIEHSIEGYFLSEVKNEFEKNALNKYILVDPKHYKHLKNKVKRQGKTIADLLVMLKDAGVDLKKTKD